MIFGNGGNLPQADLSDIEPQPTRSIFGDLFGIGPLIKMMTDPGLLASAQAMMGAITAGGEAAQRLEAKLDLLLRAQGHDVDQINKDFADNSQSAAIMQSALAALPPGFGSLGDRAITPASDAPDDGDGAHAPRNRPAPRPHGRGKR